MTNQRVAVMNTSIKSVLTTCLSLLMIVMVCFTAPSIAQTGTRTTTYLHTDGLGSVVAATDESGDVLWRKHYAPYGKQLAGSDSTEKVSYTGHSHDEDTGLTYMKARYYDPDAGRFMGVDPVGVLGSVESNPVMFNRYAYANNNPYKFVDPDGNNPAVVARISYGVGRVTVAPAINYGIRRLTAGRAVSLGDWIYGALNESADSEEKSRFIGDSEGVVVDTDVTPEGSSWQQPDGGRTDVLQGEDHGAGRSHTHRPRKNKNPKTGEEFINGLESPGSAVTAEDIDNIASGAAVPAKPKGR